MRVSLVVPTYNSAGYIELTLAEILKSLPEQITEIIVVDDGSSDNTANVLLQIAEKAKIVRVVRIDVNQGQSFATLLGIRSATEQHVMVVDDDLQYRPSGFRALISCSESQNNLGVVFGYDTEKKHSKAYNRAVETTFLLLQTIIPWISSRSPVTAHYLLNKESFNACRFHPIYPWEWDASKIAHVRTPHYNGIRRSSSYSMRGFFVQFKPLSFYLLSWLSIVSVPFALLVTALLGALRSGVFLSMALLAVGSFGADWLSHHKWSVLKKVENEFEKITA